MNEMNRKDYKYQRHGNHLGDSKKYITKLQILESWRHRKEKMWLKYGYFIYGK